MLVPSVVAADRGDASLTLARGALDLSSPLVPATDLGRVSARALGDDGWVDVEIGRCSERACVVVGPEEGERFRLLRTETPTTEPDWSEPSSGAAVGGGLTEAAQ